MIAEITARVAVQRREHAIDCIEHAAEVLEGAVAIVLVDASARLAPDDAARVRAAGQAASDALATLFLNVGAHP